MDEKGDPGEILVTTLHFSVLTKLQGVDRVDGNTSQLPLAYLLQLWYGLSYLTF